MSDALENRVGQVENRMDRVERNLELASAITLNVSRQRAEDEKAWKISKEASDKSMEALKLSIAELNESVTVLFHTVDEWVRNNPRNGGTGGPVQKS